MMKVLLASILLVACSMTPTCPPAKAHGIRHVMSMAVPQELQLSPEVKPHKVCGLPTRCEVNDCIGTFDETGPVIICKPSTFGTGQCISACHDEGGGVCPFFDGIDVERRCFPECDDVPDDDVDQWFVCMITCAELIVTTCLAQAPGGA